MLLQLSLFFIFSLSSLNAFSQIEDPFNPPADPFSDTTPAIDTSIYSNLYRMSALYQSNDHSEGYSTDVSKLSLDGRLNADWGNSLVGSTRFHINHEFVDEQHYSSGEILEAQISWTSDAHVWQFSAGRIKPQWSNGFIWNVTNLLRPYYDRPYLDEDNLSQLRGWDMVTLSHRNGPWLVTAYLVDQDKGMLRANHQSVLRLSYANNSDWSLLIYRPGTLSPAWAANYSNSLGEQWTVRLEAAIDPRRENDDTPVRTKQNHYIKAVTSITMKLKRGDEISLSYLFNEHGYSNKEWDAITSLPNTNFQPSGKESEIGQLRQNYFSLSYISPESRTFWQLFQSIEHNLDDRSTLAITSIKKSFTSNISSKFQIESFTGCDTCEYAMSPTSHTYRFVVYASF